MTKQILTVEPGFKSFLTLSLQIFMKLQLYNLFSNCKEGLSVQSEMSQQLKLAINIT